MHSTPMWSGATYQSDVARQTRSMGMATWECRETGADQEEDHDCAEKVMNTPNSRRSGNALWEQNTDNSPTSVLPRRAQVLLLSVAHSLGWTCCINSMSA